MTKARLRLQAAVSLLKLSSVEAYANLVVKNLIALAITLQVRLLAHKPVTQLITGFTGHVVPCTVGASKQICPVSV